MERAFSLTSREALLLARPSQVRDEAGEGAEGWVEGYSGRQGSRPPVARREKGPDRLHPRLVLEPVMTAEVRFVELAEEAPVRMRTARPDLPERVQVMKVVRVQEEFRAVRERIESEAALLDDLGRQLGIRVWLHRHCGRA